MVLYLIEILHQTTTLFCQFLLNDSCILLKFYIKPQHQPALALCLHGCILLKFYIKPQLDYRAAISKVSCILLKFYIKPQRSWQPAQPPRRCILLKFYIKPQRRVRYLLDFSVLRRLSGRKTERENSVEVSLMCFLYFKERKYCFFRKIPTAAACPVLPVRSCPRS